MATISKLNLMLMLGLFISSAGSELLAPPHRLMDRNCPSKCTVHRCKQCPAPKVSGNQFCKNHIPKTFVADTTNVTFPAPAEEFVADTSMVAF